MYDKQKTAAHPKPLSPEPYTQGCYSKPQALNCSHFDRIRICRATYTAVEAFVLVKGSSEDIWLS